MNNVQNANAIPHYESIRQASQCMVKAAREANWSALVEGERRCAEIIDRMRASGINVAALDPDSKRKAHEIIRAILAADAEIRELTQPWLRQLEQHIGTSKLRRRIAATYASEL